MSWRIALRLLLSLVLILNGLGDAFARAGVPVAASAPHDAAVTTERGGGACHGHDRQMPAMADTAHGAAHDAGEGCCSAGAHDCVCLQHAALVLAGVTPVAASYRRAAPAAQGAPMHLPPWLPQPIRPPILVDRNA